MDDNQGELNSAEVFTELDHVLVSSKEAARYRELIEYLVSIPGNEARNFSPSGLIYTFWIAKHSAADIGLPEDKPILTWTQDGDIAIYSNFIDYLSELDYMSDVSITVAELLYHFWCAKLYAKELDVPDEELACGAIQLEYARRKVS